MARKRIGSAVGLILAVGFFGALAARGQAAPRNLLPDPGLETGKHWRFYMIPLAKYEGKYDEQVKRKGTRSARITNVGGTGTAGWYCDPPVNVRQNTIYEVSVFVKAEGATAGQVMCYFYGPNKSHRVGLDKGTYDWKKHNFSIITPTGTKTVRLYLYNNGRGTLWFDEVSLTEKADPEKARTLVYKGTKFLYQPRYEQEDPTLGQVSEEDTHRGYILYVRKNPRHLYPTSVPQPEEIGRPMRTFATPGQYCPAWFMV